MTIDKSRLIEHAFPLKQASIDSVHEKNVRHGHISTLHVWPARRPLAACRAALIAALLPDPGRPEKRRELCEKIGGKVVKQIERKRMPSGAVVEREKEVTEGGILHWGQENENFEALEWFRQEIQNAYGGRPPRVLDPFAGGGAIPLEAMRLGCDATAIDINPVAWFILKCTLEYPELGREKRVLPEFILRDREFMETFFKANGLKGASLTRALDGAGHTLANTNRVFEQFDHGAYTVEADLAWHVRAWGRWMLNESRKELAEFYPTYADFQALKAGQAYEPRPTQLVPTGDDGVAKPEELNAEFTKGYLKDLRNPRWIAKPTVAYFWARAVKCKACRATLPLLKTRWLCKKERRRILLTMEPKSDGSGVQFDIDAAVPARGGNTAQKREHDKRIGAGTMSRSGAQCPCCGAIMTMEDIKLEGKAGRLTQILTATVREGPGGKEYRLPTEFEIQKAKDAAEELHRVFSNVPHGVPSEPLPKPDRHRAVGSQLPGYGLKTWSDLFSARQLVTIGLLVTLSRNFRQIASKYGYDSKWLRAISSYLAILVDKTADYGSSLATWIVGMEIVRGTFARFAFSWCWDWCEVNPLSDASGGLRSSLRWCSLSLDSLTKTLAFAPKATVLKRSAIRLDSELGTYDLVFTDPPYYDAIPYSDLMDFFYVWLKRCFGEEQDAFASPLSPKWNEPERDGELIDDPGAYRGDRRKSKLAYETGIATVFAHCLSLLRPNGRVVIVFAHKSPDAWETLVAAIIRAGAVVQGSWPIQSERGKRTNAITTASLASSVWLVCKKRAAEAAPGWDNRVLADMRANIRGRLREFWDAGIRGPDFIWAATGPALEAYSRHPIVKKSNNPGKLMTVSEFLEHVRAIVVEYAVGRVLGVTADEGAIDAGERLDAVTSYYLLHRNDFAFADASAGACILYAVSCGLSEHDLIATWDILIPKGGQSSDEEEDNEADSAEESEEGSGAMLRLKSWQQRTRKTLGYDAPAGREVPLIDRLHRLMQIWKEGNAQKVDDYLDEHALRRSDLFHRLAQSLIELSQRGSEERSLLESLSNHIGAKGLKADWQQERLALKTEDF